MTDFPRESFESAPSSENLPPELLALEQSLNLGDLQGGFEDRTHLKKLLLKQFAAMYLNFKELGIVGGTTETAINKYCEAQLNKLSDAEQYFAPEDLLAFTGHYYANATPVEAEDEERDGVGFIRFGASDEIRGTYGGLTVLAAPTNKELELRRSWPADYDASKPHRMLAAPAIRILCPVVIRYDDATGDSYSEIEEFSTLEIPLTYKEYLLERAV